MQLLYPCSPLRPRLPDEQFAAEVEAIRNAGFELSLFSLEDFQSGSFRAFPSLPRDAEVLYRGWMLSSTEYDQLVTEFANLGVRPYTGTQAYLGSHHLPNWYASIADLTPETHIYPVDCDLELELRTLGWSEFFIKDYVKSLKTSAGSRIGKPEQVAMVVAEMKQFRGTVEGGFCVRRVEEFLPETERRYFVIEGVAHAAQGEAPGIVQECAKRLKSRFYSVDVVRRSDGQLRVVEVGDGQVSDLVGWTPERFAEVLQRHFGRGGR